MADLEKTPVIQFRTDDSGLLKGVTSVKELKIAISQLKDDIVRMRQAGEDTTKATTDLQAAQRELNTVMGLTKKGADGVEGSYDNLVAKLREAKTEWRALPKILNGEINPAWEAARQKVEQYNTELKNYDASVGVYVRNVGNYKSALEGFTGTMGQAAQIGGDFKNGLQAVSSMMLIAGVNTEDMSGAMKNLQITVGVLQGLKGFGGLLNQIKSYFKESAKAATATKADTAAKNQNTAATTAMAGAEAGATVATTALKVALDALGIGLIIGGVALLVAHLEDIVKWLTSTAEKLGLIKARNKEQLSLVEQTKKNYEDQKEELDKQVRILQAKGRTQKEILQFQIKEIEAAIESKKAEIETAKATLQRLEAHNWLQRVLKGEQGEYKATKKALEEMSNQLKDMEKSRADFKFDLELEGYREQAEGAKKAAQASAAAQKAIEEAAKKAQTEIQKILESNIKGVDKIKKQYQELFRQLDENRKAIEKAGGDTAPADEARVVLQRQLTEALREEYKKQFSDRFKGYKDAVAITRKQADEETDIYRGLLVDLKGDTQTRLQIEREAADRRKERLQEDIAQAREYLHDAVAESDRIWETIFNANTSEGLKNLYLDMLENTEAFAQKWPEPFRTALATIGPMIVDFETETKNDLTKFVKDIMTAYEEAVNKGDLKAAAALREQLIGNPPVADSETLKAAAEDFVHRMDAQIYTAIAESDNPLAAYLSGTTWSKVLESENEPWRQILAEQTSTWAQEWDARGKILNNFNKKYNKFMAEYGNSTADVLTGTATLWEKLLQAQVKNGKKSEEDAKKQFKVVKGLQIAAAVINTAEAVTNALSKGDPYTAAARAIAVGLMGAAQVATIAATDFNAPASLNTNTEAPSITQSAPVVNTYGINPADYAEANAQNPVRVYVLEEDITNAQRSVRTRVAEATF